MEHHTASRPARAASASRWCTGARHRAAEHVAQAGIEVVRKVRVPRLLRGIAPERGQDGLGPEGALDLERLEHGKESALGVLAPQHQLLAHVLLPTVTPYPARRGTGCVWSDRALGT